ncbi:unnamed protein product, partial [Ectocarpus sp. 12 AP-2014]
AAAAPAATAQLPNDCNCEELCKPVHQVFRRVRTQLYSYTPGTAASAAVYLNGLTQEQVQHVEDISVQSTLDRAVQKTLLNEYPGGMKLMSAAAKTKAAKKHE